jgi:hypothetical protein
VSLSRLIRAAGCRWPVEEDFEFGKDRFGPGQSQVRPCTAIARHGVLVMAALATVPSPPPCSGTTPIPGHPPQPGPVSRRPPTRG